MKDSNIREIGVEELMSKIKEELGEHGSLIRQQPQQNIIWVSVQLPPIVNSEDSKSRVGKFLWEYGHRYAKSIKKVPILKKIAEKYYWHHSD